MRHLKVIFVPLILVVLIVFSITSSTRESVIHKAESSGVKFNIIGLPEHRISLIAPSDPSVTKGTAVVDPYSVVLRNTGSRSIVGYSIKWECFDGKSAVIGRDTSNDHIFSNILGVVFMYGEESERKDILSRLEGVIEPNSAWIVSPNFPAHPVGMAVDEGNTNVTDPSLAAIRALCPDMTITADGIFFDDGTFIGPDTTNFFAKVETQMAIRYEVLQGVQKGLRSGKNEAEVFKGLEQIRDSEEKRSDADQNRSYFRKLFIADILGMKNSWGTEKAIKTIQLQLSRPWVKLRKL